MKMAGHSNRVRCGFHSHHPTTKGTTHGRSQTNMPRMRSSRCRTHRLNTERRGEQGRRPVVQHCLLRSMRPRVWRVCEDRESASTTASSVSGLDKSEMNFSRSSRREKYRSRNLSIKKSISFISSHLRFLAVFGVDRSRTTQVCPALSEVWTECLTTHSATSGTLDIDAALSRDFRLVFPLPYSSLGHTNAPGEFSKRAADFCGFSHSIFIHAGKGTALLTMSSSLANHLRV